MPKTSLPDEYKTPHFEPDKGLQDVVAKATIEAKIESTKVQLLFPAHVVYTGAVSGQRYDFREPGSVLEVDSRDVPAMLAYRIGTTSCCGGSDPSGNVVFQTV